jgi:hypothetical protein
LDGCPLRNSRKREYFSYYFNRNIGPYSNRRFCMLKRIAYFNILGALVYISALLSSPDIFPNKIFPIGLLLTIYYNWTSIKRLMQLPIKWKKSVIAIGMVVLLFGILLLMDGLYKLIVGSAIDDFARVIVCIALMHVVLGTTVILQVVKSIRLYITS